MVKSNDDRDKDIYMPLFFSTASSPDALIGLPQPDSEMESFLILCMLEHNVSYILSPDEKAGSAVT